MTRVFHILTQPEDALAHRMIQQESALADCQVDTIDLTGPDPDYHALLDRLFAADSVQVW